MPGCVAAYFVAGDIIYGRSQHILPAIDRGEKLRQKISVDDDDDDDDDVNIVVNIIILIETC